jgi:hypothetical protein
MSLGSYALYWLVYMVSIALLLPLQLVSPSDASSAFVIGAMCILLCYTQGDFLKKRT